jgi:ethanolamine utilization protein EutQ (cupin superfamily)
MGEIRVFNAGRSKPEEIEVVPGVTCSVAEFPVGAGGADGMGVGLAEYRGSWDYTLNYDVIYYIIAGSLRVLEADRTFEASAGDIMFLGRGQSIRYEVINNVCIVFWASYPANWADLTDLPT